MKKLSKCSRAYTADGKRFDRKFFCSLDNLQEKQFFDRDRLVSEREREEALSHLLRAFPNVSPCIAEKVLQANRKHLAPSHEMLQGWIAQHRPIAFFWHDIGSKWPRKHMMISGKDPNNSLRYGRSIEDGGPVHPSLLIEMSEPVLLELKYVHLRAKAAMAPKGCKCNVPEEKEEVMKRLPEEKEEIMMKRLSSAPPELASNQKKPLVDVGRSLDNPACEWEVSLVKYRPQENTSEETEARPVLNSVRARKSRIPVPTPTKDTPKADVRSLPIPAPRRKSAPCNIKERTAELNYLDSSIEQLEEMIWRARKMGTPNKTSRE